MYVLLRLPSRVTVPAPLPRSADLQPETANGRPGTWNLVFPFISDPTSRAGLATAGRVHTKTGGIRVAEHFTTHDEALP